MFAKFLKQLIDAPLTLRLVEVLDRRSENRVTEFGMLAQAVEFCKINQVQGDYFEFGVWRGKTFGYARLLAKRYGYGPLMFRAFDSFEGLPEVNRNDYEVWHRGQFTCTLDEFETILKIKGFERDEYELVKGFYSDSLTPKLSKDLIGNGVKASIVYIDCDLYESTRDVLGFIGPFLQDGTVICFDDFYNYRACPDQGEQRAFTEFKTQNPEFSFVPYIAYSPLGMSFICHLSHNQHA